MSMLTERGYIVKENWSVYYCKDIDATIKWFKDVLGWYGRVDEYSEDGSASCGWVADVPEEIVMLSIQTRSGIYLFKGEPTDRVVAFIRVRGIDALYRRVVEKDWSKITEVERQPWGSSQCSITTIDGSELRLYETNNRD